MSADRLVSIITPAYKAASFIGDAIQSVRRQDYKDWEMIIVDDGSPDHSFETILDSAGTDRRIRLVRQANAGAAMARQRALDAARGRYIAFLDSDDYWLPGKLSAQVAFMQQSGAALSYTAFRRINADGTRVGHLVRIPCKLDYASLLGNTAIATSTAMVDRGLTGALAMTNTYYDDFALWLTVLKRGFVARGLQRDLMRYRVVPASLSRGKLKSAMHVWRTYREVEQLDVHRSMQCFVSYAANSLLKHARF